MIILDDSLFELSFTVRSRVANKYDLGIGEEAVEVTMERNQAIYKKKSYNLIHMTDVVKSWLIT
jgi:hypothetical protein